MYTRLCLSTLANIYYVKASQGLRSREICQDDELRAGVGAEEVVSSNDYELCFVDTAAVSWSSSRLKCLLS